MEIIKKVFGIIVIVLGVIISMTNKFFLMPYMLISFLILSVINSINFYKQNKKILALVILLFGLVITIIGILIILKDRS